jgi:hypothetical protein
MRFALVVLFLVALYFVLQPSPPADPERSIAPDTTSQQSSPPETPPPAPSPVAGAAPAPGETDDDAQPDQPAVRSGEAERAGEQRTSQHGGLRQDEVEAAIQKELTRLACLSGRAERGWGSRSRSALRRFVTRAKPKEGGTPNEALLRAMRDYPANFCRVCTRPGQAACRIGNRTPQKRSDLDTPSVTAAAIPVSEPAPEVSYLPPWMIQNGKLANVEEEVRTDVVAHTSPAEARLPEAARSRRPKRVVKRPRPAVVFRSARPYNNPPSANGWPRSY